MTRTEFEDRTLVAVSDYEFEAINTVYLASDLNKDDFCKMWRKMNASRVAQAKEAQRKAAEEMARKDMAFDIYVRLVSCQIPMDASGLLTGKQSKFLRENGIEEMGTNIYGLHYFRDNWDVALEVSRKFNLKA